MKTINPKLSSWILVKDSNELRKLERDRLECTVPLGRLNTAYANGSLKRLQGVNDDIRADRYCPAVFELYFDLRIIPFEFLGKFKSKVKDYVQTRIGLKNNFYQDSIL